MSEKEIEVIIRNAEGDELERAWVPVRVESALVGKWLTFDLSALPPVTSGDTLEIWTGTIHD